MELDWILCMKNSVCSPVVIHVTRCVIGSLESSRGFQLRMSFKESRRKIDGVQDSMKVWRRYSVLGNKRNEDIHMQRRVYVYVSGL